ncbi:hypothetical protein CTheo_1266 [Ceratobasidium theobromae]|uniref:Uncharacterized protein n=1 Tax=Ceratobasidium theobromae TaxID=1582974 RepID=A0A5N5QU51_9AGAM|nr:hypothetical protein CTheo_1266 [Ceratobasidium theobromae]
MSKALRVVLGPTNSNAVRRRSITEAAVLVAKSATRFVNLSGLRGSVDVVRGTVQALQLEVFEAPGQNDARAQELIGRAEDVVGSIVPLAENISLNVSDEDSETANYLVKVQMFIDGLERMHSRLEDIKDGKSSIKLACRKDVNRRVVENRFITTTHSNAVRRRRPIKVAAALVAKSATNLVNLPGLRGLEARWTEYKELSKFYSPTFFRRAPGKNGASARELIVVWGK